MDIFLARQPIFDRKLQLIAYELLSRNGFENAIEVTDGDEATSRVMVNSVFLIGMETLIGHKKAFINVTREVLDKDYILLFPSDKVVPEILEDVLPTHDVIAACRRLKDAGYTIALDDVDKLEGIEPLVEIADIVKVDFVKTDEKGQTELARELLARGKEVLAEKIETYDQFSFALDLGYTCFQGYFFARPQIISRREIPGSKLHYLQLLQQIHRPEVDIDELETVVRQDVSLAYRLLRYVNSAFFGHAVEIHSIRHALVLLGRNEIRKWSTLITMSNLCEEKPPELLVTAVTRARFCEGLAPHLGEEEYASELFLMGMFSVLDALVDRPFSEILEEIPVSPEIRSALLGEEGPFRTILDATIQYERGNWEEFAKAAEDLQAPETAFPPTYVSAVDWARQSFSTIQRTI